MKRFILFLITASLLLGSLVGYAAAETTETATLPATSDSTPPDDMGAPPDGTGTPPDGMGGTGGGSRSETNGTSVTTFDSDATVSDTAYVSTGDDENAVRIENSATVQLENVSVTKSGDSSNSEDSSFYGMNAGILARDGANLTLSGGTIVTDAPGGSGVFSYGNGTNVIISDVTIKASSANSGGIMLAGGGNIQAANLNIETQGVSSAAIRSDRGGGNMVVDGGEYITNGTGSPAVYSTAVITVDNATLTANASEAIVVEGKNSVQVNNCVVTGNMVGTYGEDSDENIQAVMIYQSMSGDADIGQSHFTMDGGSLTSLRGDTFYITNTSCTINLSNVTIANADGHLLKVVGNNSSRGWGVAGQNGGTCEMAIAEQTITGDILVDSISSLTWNMTENSIFTGTINQDGNAGNVSVTLDDSSVWTLTGNSYITQFAGNLENVETNEYHLFVNGSEVK